MMLVEVYLWCWIAFVNPSAEFLYFDFYTQFRNSLLLTLNSNSVGVNLIEDPLLLTKLISVGDYPRGFFLITWLISCLGLQKLFLQQPYHLVHGLVLALTVFPLLFKWNTKRLIFYYLIIFCFPFTLIMLKGLNVESAIIISTLFAVFCYRSYLIKSELFKLILFCFFAWLAIIIKHLGLLYIGIIFLAIFMWRFLRKEWPILECFLCILVLVLALPFYPENTMEYFVWVVEAHSDLISFKLLTLLGIIALIGIFLLSLFFRRNQGEKQIPLPKISLATFITCFFISQFFPVIPVEQEESLLIGLTIASLGFLFLGFCITFYEMKNGYGLLLIISIAVFSIASFLYFGNIANTIYILFLPLFILLILVIESIKSITVVGLLCIFFVIYSNFFPSEKFFQKVLAIINPDYTFDVYRKLFNSLDQAPLNWQKSHVSTTRNMVAQIFESYRYPKDYFDNGIVAYTNDFKIEDFFHLPSFEYNFPKLETNILFDISSIEELPSFQPIKLLVERLDGMQNNIQIKMDFFEPEFRNWISEGFIPIIILDNYGQQNLEDNFNKLDSKYEILSHVMNFYGAFLKKSSNLREFYYVHNLEFAERSYSIFVNKSLKLRDTTSNPKNHYLSIEISELKERINDFRK